MTSDIINPYAWIRHVQPIDIYVDTISLSKFKELGHFILHEAISLSYTNSCLLRATHLHIHVAINFYFLFFFLFSLSTSFDWHASQQKTWQTSMHGSNVPLFLQPQEAIYGRERTLTPRKLIGNEKCAT